MNSFSLKINGKDGECILFEHSAFVCQYRQAILDRVNSLGGTIVSNFEVTLPSREKLDALLFFIGFLQADAFSVTTDRGQKHLAWIKKTSKLRDRWTDIEKQVKIYEGKATPEGFNFEDSSKASLFIVYVTALIV